MIARCPSPPATLPRCADALLLESALLAVRITQLSDDVIACLNGGRELSPEEQGMLQGVNLAVRPQSIARLEADGDRLRRIVFADGTGIDRAALYLHPPIRQASPLAASLGCRLLDDGSVAVDDLGRTSVAGVYAVGDMARRTTMPLPGHQVAVAAAEGVTAAIAIDQDLLLTDLGLAPVAAGDGT